MSSRVKLALSLAIVLSCAASVNAATIRLSRLVNGGGSITVGDKVFDEFGYSGTGDMPDALDINVIDHVDLAGNFGLRFQGAFADFQGGGASDALITFRVRVADGSPFRISDAHLQGNPDVLGPEGVMAVTETFSEAQNTMSIYDIVPGNLQNIDWTYFDQTFTELHVQKNIIAWAGQGSAATLSFVDQTFSQVPEPARSPC